MKHIRTTALAALLSLAALNTAVASDTVDINSASAETLAAAIDGVGARRAQAIVDYRQMHGPFRSVEDLLAVRGIGPKLLEASRARLTVD